MSLAGSSSCETPSTTTSLKLFDILKCTLIEDYGKFFNEQLFCDMQFILGTEEEIKIKAHMAFVAARSKYLREKLLEALDVREQHIETVTDSSCIENRPYAPEAYQEPLIEIRLQNANPEAFGIILRYIYTDRIDFKESCDKNIILITDIFQLSVLFQMQHLKDSCLHYLQTKMNQLNVLEALIYADNNKIQIVKDISMQFLNKTDLNYNMPDGFCDLDKHLLLEIIRNKFDRYKPRICCDMDKIKIKSLQRDMAAFLESGKEFCDIDLNLDGHVIKAHKSILAARSQYFRVMFRSFTPPDKVDISIGDLLPSVEAFQTLLFYIYYGKTGFPPQDAVYLLQASYFYGLSNNHLHWLCKHYCESNITYANVLQTLEAADNAKIFDIKDRALKFIPYDFARVAALPKFSSLSRELLLEVISCVHSDSQYKLA